MSSNISNSKESKRTARTDDLAPPPMPVIPDNLAPPPMPVIPANLAPPPMPVISSNLAPPPMPVIRKDLAPPPMPVIPANLAPPPMPVIPANLAPPPMPVIRKDLAPPPMPVIPASLAPPPMPVIPPTLDPPPMPVIPDTLDPPPMPVIRDDAAPPLMAAHVSYTSVVDKIIMDSRPAISSERKQGLIPWAATPNYTEQQLRATYDQIIDSSVGDSSYDGKVTTFKNLRLHQLQSEILTYNALEEIDAGLAGIESSLEKHLYTGRDE
ncbi:hypothetical protein JR316_0002620 [Psilocybe cubensis]|uniref:Uncharacterized protein n=1 Tax=Psilocybe cubensis TaxID=181762 RepID=A0ACB8HDH3_PSICU|nr:hypothetical protein JR316_0002620 [Psilocybe cubensis]KAH9485707.1 hypothetical protein JR316_0002620 [Psilocybe cubensis]